MLLIDEEIQIGLMRNGRLLGEDSPKNLMNKYNTYILEDIVIQLCLQDTSSKENGEKDNRFNTSATSQVTTSRNPSSALGSAPANTSNTDVPDFNYIPDKDEHEIIRIPSPSQGFHRTSNEGGIEKYDFWSKSAAREKLERIYALLNKNVLVLFRNFV